MLILITEQIYLLLHDAIQPGYKFSVSETSTAFIFKVKDSLFTLRMEAAGSCRILVNFYYTTVSYPSTPYSSEPLM